MGHRAQNQASAMVTPVFWAEPYRKWVELTEENAKSPSWICESKGSGVILDEGMISDLLSVVL